MPGLRMVMTQGQPSGLKNIRRLPNIRIRVFRLGSNVRLPPWCAPGPVWLNLARADDMGEGEVPPFWKTGPLLEAIPLFCGTPI